MKTSNAVLTGLAVAVIVAGLAWAIDVDVSGDTELPSVDMEMTEGEMPEVDVEAVDVDVTEEQGTIRVPNVDVNMEEKTIPYPNIDVQHKDGAQDGVANEDDMSKMNDGVDNEENDTGDGETEMEDNNLAY